MTRIIRVSGVLLTCLWFTTTSACESKIVENTNHIGFVGCISADSARVFLEAWNQNPRSLVIQSEGGDVRAALRIAKEIRQKPVSLRIRGYCNSSCANYLLPAARTVYVEVNSQIVYHGDARLTLERFSTIDYVDPLLLNFLDSLSQQEIEFEVDTPKAALIHRLQKIATTRVKKNVLMTIDGFPHECQGMGMLPWSPSIPLLIKSKIVTDLVDVDNSVMPEITFRQSNSGFQTEEDERDPMKTCEKIAY